nr:hypothetical protein [Pseudomonas sp. Lz4W]
MVAHPEQPKAARINRHLWWREQPDRRLPSPRGGGGKMAPRPNFSRSALVKPVQGVTRVRSIRAAPLACASGETGPTWIRDVAVEKGTKDRNETSRNCRMQVGPALPGAHAGEFSRQARSGRR